MCKDTQYKYVHDPEYDYSASVGENVKHSEIKSSRKNIIDQYLEDRNTNQYAVNQLSEDIRKNVKDPLDRMAATAYVQAGGNPELVQARLNGESGFMSDLKSKISDYQSKVTSLPKEDNHVLNNGTVINATDRGNYGKVTGYNPSTKIYTVHFESKAGATADVSFTRDSIIPKDNPITANDYNYRIAEAQKELEDMQGKVEENSINLDKPYIQNGNGKDTGYTYRQIYEKALNLDPNTQGWANEALRYTNELGDRSQRLGTIGQLEENHLSQSWEKPNIDRLTPEQLAENKQAALEGKVNLKSSLGTGTNHNAHKVYADYATGIMNGETPRTMDIADVIQREGVDMAHANAKQAFVQQMVDDEVAQAVDRIPAGFKEIAQSGGKKVVVPEQLADALDPITNPNSRRMTTSKIYNDVCNNLKTINLGLSAFHHKNFVIAGINNGDLKPLAQFAKELFTGLKRMDDSVFRTTERDGIVNGLETTMLQKNLDTNMRLGSDSESIVGESVNKIKTLPVLKQVSSLIEANNKLLFDKMQRFLKVQSYSLKTNSWLGKHPNATEAEVTAAKRSIARHTNGVYGGLTWENLGINPAFRK